MRIRLAILFLVLTALPARTEEAREFTLSAPPEIVASGLLDYILPRFALKTGRRARLVEGTADARLGPAGPGAAPVMARGEALYALDLAGDNDAAHRFADWLGSEIGRNTLASFAPTDGPRFSAPPEVLPEAPAPVEGVAALGREVAHEHCARCHRVAPGLTAMTLGSTPSFAALKTLSDWADRFAAFYALNPHPAFLRVEGISPPFDPARPPPIVPVEITAAEAEALSAYVAGIPAADLGADIQSR